MQKRLAAALVIAYGAVALAAQTPKPTFEVASVKRNLSASSSSGIRPQAAGVFTATNTTVAAVIRFAYALPAYQIVGGPRWVRTDRFDIAARASQNAPSTELRLMTQALLEDRFKLVVRHEQRQMPILALLLVRDDGRLGPKFAECNAKGAVNPPEQKPSRAPAGGAVAAGPCGPMSAVADLASRVLGIPVVDRTGAEGLRRYEITFGSDALPTFGGAVPPSPDPPARDPNLPSFTAALQEQLGLKLERQQGLVDLLVIDSVQQPTDN
jgi:uncharacterized protein (TIGR03435 family)